MAGLTLTAHCKTLTPMLSGGANPRETFELRAQSVKGALRFWWRAFHAYETEAKLFEEESRLFGGKMHNSSDNQWEAVASSFRLDVFSDLHTKKVLKPGRGSGFGDNISSLWGDGIRYFLFPVLHHKGMIHNSGKGGKPVVREGLRFRIRVFVPDGNKAVLEDMLRALWLLMNLGGLGGRSRRGAGAFVVEKFRPALKELSLSDVPDFDCGSYEEPAKYIKDGVDMIRNKWFHIKPPFSLPDYTAFRPGHSEIHVCLDPDCRQGAGALKAMEAVGQRMKKFRYINPYEEARQMHHALTGEGPTQPKFKVLEKAQMGLPIIYNFRGRGQFDNKREPPKIVGGYKAEGVVYDETRRKPNEKSEKNVNRRASPLLISCHVFKKRPYAVICHFPAPILPDGQRIWLKSKRGDHDHYPKAPTGYDYTDRMLKTGDVINGKKLPSIFSAFRECRKLYSRPRAVASVSVQKAAKPLSRPGTGSARPPQASARPVRPTSVPEPGKSLKPPALNSAPEPDESLEPEDLEKQKINCLRKSSARKDKLPWFLGEISGPPSESGKKQKWPCILWYLEGETLKKEPDKWYVRNKQLSSVSRVKQEKDSLFLCTKKSDAHTPSQGQYLYNIAAVPK